MLKNQQKKFFTLQHLTFLNGFRFIGSFVFKYLEKDACICGVIIKLVPS